MIDNEKTLTLESGQSMTIPEGQFKNINDLVTKIKNKEITFLDISNNDDNTFNIKYSDDYLVDLTDWVCEYHILSGLDIYVREDRSVNFNVKGYTCKMIPTDNVLYVVNHHSIKEFTEGNFKKYNSPLTQKEFKSIFDMLK